MIALLLLLALQWTIPQHTGATAASGGGGTVVRAAGCGQYGTNPSCTATFGTMPASGDQLVAIVTGNTSTAVTAISTPSGTALSWAYLTGSSSTSCTFTTISACVFVGSAGGTSSSVALAVTGSGAAFLGTITDLSGFSTVADVSPVFYNGAYCTTCTGTTITPATAGDALLAMVSNGITPATDTSTWTKRFDAATSGQTGQLYSVVGAGTTATGPTWTWSGSAYAEVLVALKP
jgi:hypothetical protein